MRKAATHEQLMFLLLKVVQSQCGDGNSTLIVMGINNNVPSHISNYLLLFPHDSNHSKVTREPYYSLTAKPTSKRKNNIVTMHLLTWWKGQS